MRVLLSLVCIIIARNFIFKFIISKFSHRRRASEISSCVIL